MEIQSRLIGGDSPAYIIAELSANHNGNINNAIDAIILAKKAGADAIKLQTYTPDTITLDSDKEYFKIKHGTIWDGTTLHKLYQKAFTPWKWHKKLFNVAKEQGITCFSSPFDETAVEFLEDLDCPAYKIASPEILDVNLIKKAAQTMKPIIISTGIATLKDIELAIDTCKKVSNNNIAILKCTSEYPAPISRANLLTISDMKKRFNLIAGLSDHTLGYISPVVAVSLGAKIIEKHFITDKKIGGPDASFSLDYNEFKLMVEKIRCAEASIGNINYRSEESVVDGHGFIGRSLFFVKNLKKGEKITHDNVKSIRPGTGMHPKFLESIIGNKVKQNIDKGTPVRFDLINNIKND